MMIGFQQPRGSVSLFLLVNMKPSQPEIGAIEKHIHACSIDPG